RAVQQLRVDLVDAGLPAPDRLRDLQVRLINVEQQRTQLLHSLDQTVPLGQQRLAVRTLVLLWLHEVVHVHRRQSGDHRLGDHFVNGLALAGQVEQCSATIRWLLAAVLPRDERRSALPAENNPREQVTGQDILTY